MPNVRDMIKQIKSDEYSYLSDETLGIYFFRLKFISENISSGNIAIVNNPTLSDQDRLYLTTAKSAANVAFNSKQTLSTIDTARIKTTKPDDRPHVGEHLPYMVNETSLLKDRTPDLTDSQLLKAYEYYKYLRDEAIGSNDIRKARQEQERINVLLNDQRLIEIFNTGEFPLADVLNPPILRGSANRLFMYNSRYPETAYNDMSFGAAKPMTSVEKTKDNLSKLLTERNVVYKQLLNKNIDQGEILALRQKKYLIEKGILTAKELLESASIIQLDKYYQNISGMMPTATPQTQPPTVQPPRTQAPKTDIQPMIMNAQQIIADETAVYNKKVAGTASEDELKVKQESSASAIIPIFKAIFKVKPDEVQALHAGIADKVWKAMLLDRMPEINRPTEPVPIPVPPKPTPTPTPTPEPTPPPIEPAKDKNKLQSDISAKLVEILPIYDAWDQEDTGNKNFLYKSIASICNAVLALLESGRKGGLNVKAEINLNAIGGNNVLNGIKDELWDDFTKGTPWNESDTIEVPSPFQFSQELTRLCQIVVSKQDEIDQQYERLGRISEADIFNIVRPSVNDVINYLIKGKKWYNNDIRQFKQYIVNTIGGKGTGKIADAFNKLPDLIYSHGNAGTLFDEQGESGTKLPDLPNVSGAEFTSQIKSLVDGLNGTIDNWNAMGDDRPTIQQNTANFYPVVLNDVNKLVDKYIDRDRYEADGRFNRSFRNDMDNQLNAILPAEPFNKNLSKDLKQKILDHAKDKTPFTVGGRRRGRPAGGRKITKEVAREYRQIQEFGKKSFTGLKMPNEGDIITDKLQKPFVLKNPGIGRVDKYREGAGKKKMDYVHNTNVDDKREALMKKLMKKSGKGNEDDDDSEDVKSWKSFLNKPTVHDVIDHLTKKGVQILRKAWLFMKDKYDHTILTAFLIYYTLGTEEYISLTSNEFEDNLHGVLTLFKKAMATVNVKTDKETYKKLVSDWEKVLKQKTIIALGKGKVDIEIDTSDSESDDEMPKKKTAGRKKVGHKKTKPTFTEI